MAKIKLSHIFAYSLLGMLLSSPLHAKDFVFTAIGDQPYGNYEPSIKLIQKINQQKNSQFTIHVGDIKNGGSECSDKTFSDIKKMFDSFQKPLIYTPGDNEWTDCHRQSNGSYEPTERLEKIRQLFFKEPISLGIESIKLQSQSKLSQEKSIYVENLRWSKDNILLMTLHQVGSNNNLDPKIPGAIKEYEARNQANIQWLESGFALAKQQNNAAIVIAMQADTFHPKAPKVSGFSEFIASIEKLALEFNKPVLLIQGDSHEFIVDHPLQKINNHSNNNVIRLVVPGANLTEAVEVKINSGKKDAAEFFTFKRYSIH
jgi:hypothetical protein